VRKISRGITKRTENFNVVYTRDDCVRSSEDGEYTKPLINMVNEHPTVGPLKHLFVLDDREVTFKDNTGNGIMIPIYKPSPTESSLRMDDDYLLRLKYWLSQPEIMESEDITEIDKKDVFKKTVAQYIEERKARKLEAIYI
jgi:hypothetical protein